VYSLGRMWPCVNGIGCVCVHSVGWVWLCACVSWCIAVCVFSVLALSTLLVPVCVAVCVNLYTCVFGVYCSLAAVCA